MAREEAVLCTSQSPERTDARVVGASIICSILASCACSSCRRSRSIALRSYAELVSDMARKWGRLAPLPPVRTLGVCDAGASRSGTLFAPETAGSYRAAAVGGPNRLSWEIVAGGGVPVGRQ